MTDPLDRYDNTPHITAALHRVADLLAEIACALDGGHDRANLLGACRVCGRKREVRVKTAPTPERDAFGTEPFDIETEENTNGI